MWKYIHWWKVQLVENLDALHSAEGQSGRSLHDEDKPLQSVLGLFEHLCVQPFTFQHLPCCGMWHKDTAHSSCVCAHLIFHHMKYALLLHNCCSSCLCRTCICPGSVKGYHFKQLPIQVQKCFWIGQLVLEYSRLASLLLPFSSPYMKCILSFSILKNPPFLPALQL